MTESMRTKNDRQETAEELRADIVCLQERIDAMLELTQAAEVREDEQVRLEQEIEKAENQLYDKVTAYSSLFVRALASTGILQAMLEEKLKQMHAAEERGEPCETSRYEALAIMRSISCYNT